MSSTKDVSEIWWENKTGFERLELMKAFNIKKHSKKAVRKMYNSIYKNFNKN